MNKILFDLIPLDMFDSSGEGIGAGDRDDDRLRCFGAVFLLERLMGKSYTQSFSFEFEFVTRIYFRCSVCARRNNRIRLRCIYAPHVVSTLNIIKSLKEFDDLSQVIDHLF